ncbi:unnamed protein product [Diatraea saccharalis]|uniref:Uncharacterized protein n=1 Tax=Diatraea saccharalis TaxID=40085 RepID=A0A9N9RE91_9NEOP|nr:unnamed protein product [Diatraea saccharalis]
MYHKNDATSAPFTETYMITYSWPHHEEVILSAAHIVKRKSFSDLASPHHDVDSKTFLLHEMGSPHGSVMSCQSLAARAFAEPEKDSMTHCTTFHRSVRFSSESRSSTRASTENECKRETPGSISLTALTMTPAVSQTSAMTQSAPPASNTFDMADSPAPSSTSCRFPKLEECAHFHYERVSLGGLSIEALPCDEKCADPDEGWILVRVRSHVNSSCEDSGDVRTLSGSWTEQSDVKEWTLYRNRTHLLQLDDMLHSWTTCCTGDALTLYTLYTSVGYIGTGRICCSWTTCCTGAGCTHTIHAVHECWLYRNWPHMLQLDDILHRCIYDRKVSGLPDLKQSPVPAEEDGWRRLVADYLHHLSIIADDALTCGPLLNWLQMDNKGHKLLVSNEDSSSINTPAVAAAYSVRKYVSQARDEISFEVGDMISIIDMPGPNESLWWRGKRGFRVGFFPHHCVAVIGDKVPRHMTQPPPIVGGQGAAPHDPEHLLNCGHDVPQVLVSCAAAIEARGPVDGVYRLSGGSGLTQRLRAAFDANAQPPPDLAAPPVARDPHAVPSLLKMYFRELPNPLCTYQLYESFVQAVQQDEANKLRAVRDTVVKLPPPHYR